MRPAPVQLHRGEIPDYGTFVRHVWAYRQPDTGAPVVDGPPWVYTCLVEGPREWTLIARAVRRLRRAGRVSIEPIEMAEATAYQVQFADLEALHRVLCLLAAHYGSYHTQEAAEVVEFVLWTLGFCWV